MNPEIITAGALALNFLGGFAVKVLERASVGSVQQYSGRLIQKVKDRLHDGNIPANHDLLHALNESLVEATWAFALGVAAQLEPNAKRFSNIHQ